jgi:hypothetical protein
VPAPQYVNLEFPYRSPKQRLRRGIWLALACLGVAGVGAAMMVPLGPRKSDAAMAPADQVSHTETIPAVSPIGYAAVDPPTASDHGAQAAGKHLALARAATAPVFRFSCPRFAWSGSRSSPPPAPASMATQRSLVWPLRRARQRSIRLLQSLRKRRGSRTVRANAETTSPRPANIHQGSEAIVTRAWLEISGETGQLKDFVAVAGSGCGDRMMRMRCLMPVSFRQHLCSCPGTGIDVCLVVLCVVDANILASG